MRLRRLIPATVLALAATGLVAAPAHAAPVDYVAMGDSYSSGVGAPGATGSCARSPQGYPTLWRNSHEVSSFADVTCGGAVTDDVLRNQVTALSAATDLVTISIGGNDAGFASAVLSCSFGGSTTCRRAVENGLANSGLAGRLDRTYAEIERRAPDARVIVLGYPRLFEETRFCGFGSMSLTNRRIMNQGADALTAAISTRAVAAGLEFVDVRQAFAGHGICAGTPWINGSSGTGAYHPNAAGYRGGYLAALNAVTG